MALGVQLKRNQQLVPARLYLTYSGVVHFSTTGWSHWRASDWVLDYINHGRQSQRIGNKTTFTRSSNVAALYAPGTRYHERCIAGDSLDESYIVFGLSGELAGTFRALVGRAGYCHFRDSEQLIGARLRSVAELLFHGRRGAHVSAHGVFLELLGLVLAAAPISNHLREVSPSGHTSESRDWLERVEHYIRQHITGTIRVADLARCVGSSPSSFAHVYPRRAGESPYRTVRRLKIQAAKKLLLQDGLSVKETAARLGFSSEFQFSRTFKLVEGVAPKRYVLALTRKARNGRSD